MMDSFTIPQWNINGFINNFNELQLLIREHNPAFISLQETHCEHNLTPIPPKGYTTYFRNNNNNITSEQGVGIFVKNKIANKKIHINSTLKVIS